jgi:hypothetical protein
MIRPLNGDEARRLLSSYSLGRLGCLFEGTPYVVPICYVYDGDSLYSHSLPGRKITAMRDNPRVCLQADEIKDESHWKSVIAFGTYEEITDPQERERVVRKFFARFPYLTPVESVPVHDGQSSVVVFRIRISEITGVSERPIR